MVRAVTKFMVYDYVLECGEVTAMQVARHFGCGVMVACGLLQRLRSDGKLTCSKNLKKNEGATWYPDPNYYVKVRGYGY